LTLGRIAPRRPLSLAIVGLVGARTPVTTIVTRL
jgi:hypothetical protein